MKKFLLTLPALALLASCVKSGGEVKLDDLLKVAGSTTGKSIISMASSGDAKTAAKQLLAAKRRQWANDPLQLARDLREAQHDFNRLMDALSGKVRKEWGKKEVLLPEKKTYVKYIKQYKSRAIVNFEQGEIRVESLESSRESLKNAIIATLLTPEDPASVDVFSDSAIDLNSNSKPFLQGLVLNDTGQPITTPELAASFADIALTTSDTRKLQTDSGERLARFVIIKMVTNFEDKKAEKYLPLVRKYAAQYDVSPSLILGIMRSESSFNPHAVSSAPAYGLMQLVPGSGGREAYRRAKNEDLAPSKDYLFDAENNIELGTAYLSVLLYDQLNGVEDRISRDYCVISAYNTGPSNVMKAFTDVKGKQRLKDGIAQINSLTAARVFQELREKLPYSETRSYLPTVNNNRKRYYGVDKTIAENSEKPASATAMEKSPEAQP